MMGEKVKIVIKHNSSGWVEIFKSAEMQNLVNTTGQRIASEAGEHFHYSPAEHSQYTAGGFVGCDAEGALQEAIFKTLTRAVHK